MFHRDSPIYVSPQSLGLVVVLLFPREIVWKKKPNKPTLEILELYEVIKLLARLFLSIYIVFLSSPSYFLDI